MEIKPSILFCCVLDLWITIQPDDGLCKKPKDVAEVLINTEVVLECYCYGTIHV